MPSGPGWKISAHARSTSGSPIAAISQSTTASRSRRRLGREEHVVELVVAVAQRARLIGRAVRLEPVADVVGQRAGRARRTTRAGSSQRVSWRDRYGPVWAMSPSPHAAQSTAWIATSASISSSRARPWVSGAAAQASGTLAQDRDPVDPLHHVERRAEHLRVVAGRDRAGDRAPVVLDRVEDAELAQHVVGGRRAGVARCPAQHPARRRHVRRRRSRTSRRRASASTVRSCVVAERVRRG